MTQWTKKPLGEVAELCLGKMLDEKKNKGELLPYLANVNVRWGNFDFDFENQRQMRFAHNEMDRYGLRRGDIVMCEGGEPGRCAIWQETTPGMMIQKALHRIRPYRCIDHRYLFYFFLHTGRIGGFAPFFTGATIKHLPKQSLAKVEIEYPQLHIQERIADILSVYDHLIENNRRRMTLLEDSGRLLYNEWFVRLRFPGYEHVSIVDGVPQGWDKKTLGETITLNYGKALKAEMRIEGEYPVYGSSGIVGTHEKPLVTGPAIILGRKGNVGSVYWASKSFYPIDTVYYVDAESSSLYLFYALKHMHFISTDVAVPGLNREFAYSRALLHPPATLLRTFHETVEAIHAQLDKLNESNQKLRAARDLLLPRLMSGELAA
ncbi:restriction endonuclease subunit S [Janthinobacterium sp. UMAB-60]|uniref:restriction endonuclease subunit S n=1 Tax=Janthinobacterium sp. UMAB-60 TaxID=1365365 RepID=UPI001C56ABE0|nr:restriction endonuclease subunit S [Janthinobacterium sp. UMAB-60]